MGQIQSQASVRVHSPAKYWEFNLLLKRSFERLLRGRSGSSKKQSKVRDRSVRKIQRLSIARSEVVVLDSWSIWILSTSQNRAPKYWVDQFHLVIQEGIWNYPFGSHWITSLFGVLSLFSDAGFRGLASQDKLCRMLPPLPVFAQGVSDDEFKKKMFLATVCHNS